ncbi:hypothetical protein HPP92_027188 [Vanilla planifolia]|uniref:Uncharacterized protein n=1 Tax=Vanilla planifolia TaxID=51239 RepID=A0A835P9R6_VANPL|nr:hypothetical protein HPP92_027188 [Vanilla planifolia]
MGDCEENKEFLGALEVLRRASEDMETNPLAFVDEFSAAPSHFVKALLALQSDASDLLSNDPRLATLSHLLFRLKSFASSCSPSSLRRHSYRREISRLAASIGSEINSWIHRESLNRLVSSLRSAPFPMTRKLSAASSPSSPSSPAASTAGYRMPSSSPARCRRWNPPWQIRQHPTASATAARLWCLLWCDSTRTSSLERSWWVRRWGASLPWAQLLLSTPSPA